MTDTELADAIAAAHAGRKSQISCPAHGDETPSLSVAPGSEHPVVLYDHAGCTPEEILSAAGLDFSAISTPLDTTARDDGEWTPKGTASHVYSYPDEDGVELFQVLRVPQPNGKKAILQRHWNAEEGKWSWNIQDVRRVLYRLPEVLRWVADGLDLTICEGEKDVETARLHGLHATTSPMGAGKWRDEYAQVISGASVTIVADADGPGRKHARDVADSLVAHDCQVRIVETTLPGCNDLTDHLAHGGTLDSMVETYRFPEDKPAERYGLGIQDFLSSDFPEDEEVIEGVLARANVAIVVGPEGHGKSTLLRQAAICTAAGINFLYDTPQPPRKVLYIDAENPEHQQLTDWRRLAGLAARRTGAPVPNHMLTILSEWRVEPNLLSPSGEAWLYERINAFQPDLCIMGPVNNLLDRDTKDDEVARKFKKVVNSARAICGTAFIIEHHAPHRQAGDSKREMRPYGSSQFMKWPDVGYGLTPTDDEGVYHLHPFRRPRVRRRAWPTHIRYGRPNTLEWPWMEHLDERGSVRMMS